MISGIKKSYLIKFNKTNTCSNHKITDGIGKVKIDGKIYTSEYSSLSIYNTKIVKDLIKHGCTNKKTFTITFPELREDLIRHFIRGYFDGDGCINKIKDRDISYIILIAGNYNFMNKFGDLLTTEINVSKHLLKNKKIYSLNYYNINDINKMYNFMYYNSNTYLYRKKEIFDTIKSLK